MAKKHSTRRLTHVREDKPSAALRKLNFDARDQLHGRLVRAQSALITAILALEGGGVHGEVSNSLRSHVYFPLRDLTEALDGKVVLP